MNTATHFPVLNRLPSRGLALTQIIVIITRNPGEHVKWCIDIRSLISKNPIYQFRRYGRQLLATCRTPRAMFNTCETPFPSPEAEAVGC